MDLPEPADQVGLAVGSFAEAEPVVMAAAEIDDKLLVPVASAAEGIQEGEVNGSRIVALDLTGGGNEGTVIRVCIDGNWHRIKIVSRIRPTLTRTEMYVRWCHG
jgi:hypothetical protein